MFLRTSLLVLTAGLLVQGYFLSEMYRNGARSIYSAIKSLRPFNLDKRQTTKQLSEKYKIETLIKIGTQFKLIPEEEKDPAFWRQLGTQQLRENLRKHLNTNKAKNIIFFLGDGMSVSTITAARILKGQRKGNTGEEERLSFEKFPYTGLSKTYCTNAQVADSGCSATAYLCGVKGNIGTIGVNANVAFNNCSASMDPMTHVSSIAQWAQKAGKSTGFITTTRLTHASPSGLYAHVASRLYESDKEVKLSGLDPSTCMDIATQLVTQEPGRNFDVMMGGGMSKFLPNNVYDIHGNLGIREDGKNLLSTWKDMHNEGVVVTNRDDLLSLNPAEFSNILGVFQSDKMDFHLSANPAKQPTLSEMTAVALEFLQRNDKGYFIFIEGGLIDTAHHSTKAELSLDETLEFEKAVQLARSMTDPRDTLIVVSSDHGHPLTFTGFPSRGNDILGINHNTPDANGLNYFTLNYPLGPKQYVDTKGNRLNVENIKRSPDFEYPSFMKSPSGVHSGEDVAIFSSGPFDHLFTGVLEENTIPYLMAYASCIGDGPTLCDDSFLN